MVKVNIKKLFVKDNQENEVVKQEKTLSKEECIALEKKLDKLLERYIGDYTEVSLALTNKLKVQFDYDQFITLFDDLSSVAYVKYEGDYSHLKYCIRQTLACIQDNKELFEKLLKSYRQ